MVVYALPPSTGNGSPSMEELLDGIPPANQLKPLNPDLIWGVSTRFYTYRAMSKFQKERNQTREKLTVLRPLVLRYF